MFTGVIDSGIGALDRIIASKKEEVRAEQARMKQSDEEVSLEFATAPKGFAKALNTTVSAGRNALICEIKRRSPSAGDILLGADPIEIARSYQEGGASCLSVLTDGPFFGGNLQDLRDIAQAVDIPLLRKDFIIATSQILAARAAGADCVLLIVAILEDSLATELATLAQELDMDVLLEVHTRPELERALELPHNLLGINNRDLRVMQTRLETTAELAHYIPESHHAAMVSESGVHSVADIQKLRRAGARRFLIGESLMKANNRAKAVSTLCNGY